MDYVYCWADGLHFGVRLDADRVCTLVVIGVRADGKKELVALTDGHRKSTESWAGLAAGRQAAGHARAGAGRRGRRGTRPQVAAGKLNQR